MWIEKQYDSSEFLSVSPTRLAETEDHQKPCFFIAQSGASVILAKVKVIIKNLKVDSAILWHNSDN